MECLEYPFDGKTIMRKRRAIRRELLCQDNLLEKHIAVLGGSTTHDIKEILELFLLNYGIKPVFFESEYAQYWQDAVFGNDALKGLKPDIIYIHTSNRNIPAYPKITDSETDINALLEHTYSHFQVMWDKLREEYACPIIQNNFESPYFRLLGNQDAWNIRGRTNFISRLNQKFYDYAQHHSDFFINDINYLSADYGLQAWSDPYSWHMYKYALCQDAIPTLAFNIANMIKSIYGKNRKALALDLDNTLWGGVVGDDGADNLELGQETSMGQAYAEFQQYLKGLRSMGILLTVVSKNEMENAIAGIRHPQMLLKEEDFVRIKANWEPKSRNLMCLAEELSLLPESFVFVDDNPAEREIVRQQVPRAAVPLMERPEDYIRAIDRAGYFEMTNLSADDMKRNDMYRENMKRAALESAFSDYHDYLLSLDMHADIRPFQPVYLARIAQLTNKSNQFNLTTRRYTREELERAAADPRCITLYGKLADRFGDNGVVSVVIGRQEDERLDIVLWLMSCRVLKRDMEFAMMDTLVERCRERGIRTIRGYYYPTAKNAMVKGFYGTQGFRKVEEGPSGDTVWECRIDQGYQRKNHVIQINGGTEHEEN